jgi:hypothetical protein
MRSMFGINYFALSGLLHPSPERAKYTSEAVTPLAINISEAATSLATKMNQAETRAELIDPLLAKNWLYFIVVRDKLS